MKRLVMAGLAALALMTAQARALTGPHVDPKAPCFRYPAVDMDGDGVFDRIDHCVNTPKGCVVDQYGCETDSDHDGVCDGLDQCPDTPPHTVVDSHGCPGGAHRVPTPQTTPTPAPPPAPEPARPRSEMERQLVETGSIRLENIYFETASSRLLPESEAALREAGETLERYPELRIEVQGHTDTRGWARYNKRLSETRAEAVRSFLLQYFKLKPENYIARGYGEMRPETEERNEEEMLRNRRVVLKVLNPEALPKGVKVEKENKK